MVKGKGVMGWRRSSRSMRYIAQVKELVYAPRRTLCVCRGGGGKPKKKTPHRIGILPMIPKAGVQAHVPLC
jgi:hypothetical protein